MRAVVCLITPDIKKKSPDTPDTPDTPQFTGYYAPITATSGDALLGQIHDLITTTHTHYSTYGDIRKADIVGKTDKGSTDGYIMDFYTQEDISIEWNSGSPAGAWNREHLWCTSLSNGLWSKVNNDYIGGGADLHHLRPSEVKLNADRGNKKYGEVKDSGSSYATLYYKDSSNKDKYVGGYSSGNTFEPLDKVKGDVARIVLYVYTHYNPYANVHGTTNGTFEDSNFRTLNFKDIMAPNVESEAIALLLKWNELDPVDEIETARNEAVFAIQGNRNPFVDHPEFVKAIWG
ncbi:MAG: endonuclease [Clostridia bacterium]|nr:endonuclease [Clostridia bacterium]